MRLAWALLLSGCVQLMPHAEMCVEESPKPADLSGLTWHQDIAPIFAAKCQRCHEGKGPGPMSLVTYADVQAVKERVASAISNGTMPPWPPASCCGKYDRSGDLTLDEQQKIESWLARGALPGPIAPAPPVSKKTLDRVDLTLQMSEPYTPNPPAGQTDETRCFLLDYEADETVWVTGIDIHSQAPKQMHHALVLTAGPNDVKKLQALDARDEGLGWACPGGVLGAFKGFLGGSFFEAQQWDNGTGHELKKGDKLILTMHYSQPGTFLPDQVKVLLRTQKEPVKPQIALSVFDPAWLLGAMPILANEESRTYTYADEFSQYNGGRAWDARSVSLHMHERGVKGQLAILRRDGSRECLLQIDRWNHDWQGDYVFEKPVRIEPGDRLLVSCTFDNTAPKQKRIGGEHQTPRNLNWGEDQEMCVGFVIATEAD
jgi:hypothetical protein